MAHVNGSFTKVQRIREQNLNDIQIGVQCLLSFLLARQPTEVAHHPSILSPRLQCWALALCSLSLSFSSCSCTSHSHLLLYTVRVRRNVVSLPACLPAYVCTSTSRNEAKCEWTEPRKQSAARMTSFALCLVLSLCLCLPLSVPCAHTHSASGRGREDVTKMDTMWGSPGGIERRRKAKEKDMERKSIKTHKTRLWTECNSVALWAPHCTITQYILEYVFTFNFPYFYFP